MRAPDNHDLDLDHNINKVVTGYLPFTIPFAWYPECHCHDHDDYVHNGDGDESNEDDGDTDEVRNDTGQLSESLRCSRSWLAYSINVGYNTITVSCQLLK